jgi:hypothetical protein
LFFKNIWLCTNFKVCSSFSTAPYSPNKLKYTGYSVAYYHSTPNLTVGGNYLKSGPSRNLSISKCILRFRGPRKEKTQPGAEAAFAVACEIGVYESLDSQKCI